jgi:hypothetical protein
MLVYTATKKEFDADIRSGSIADIASSVCFVMTFIVKVIMSSFRVKTRVQKCSR